MVYNMHEGHTKYEGLTSLVPPPHPSLPSLTHMHTQRNTLRFPSAVIRSRLQEAQKCSLIEVMNPIRPVNPGTL